MIYLLDTSHDYDECAIDLGVSKNEVGQLVTPLTGRSNHFRDDFAIDNGAFSCFNPFKFANVLRRNFVFRHRCRFVCAPDVVGNAMETTKLFHIWKSKLVKWKIAYVLQDGLRDEWIPWNECQAVFVGGSDVFKDSYRVSELIKIAQSKGLWTHAGRVNGPKRVEHFKKINIHSIDGTGISRYQWMRIRIKNHFKKGK